MIPEKILIASQDFSGFFGLNSINFCNELSSAVKQNRNFCLATGKQLQQLLKLANHLPN